MPERALTAVRLETERLGVIFQFLKVFTAFAIVAEALFNHLNAASLVIRGSGLVLESLLLVAALRFREVRAWVWFSIPFFDLPMMLGEAVNSWLVSPSPHASALDSRVSLLLLVIGAAFSLRLSVIASTGTLTAAGLAIAHWVVIGPDWPYAITTFVYIGMGTLGLCLFVRRLLNLVDDAAHERSSRERLSRYFSPEVSARILRETQRSSGDVRDVTVLFCDIRDFTALCEPRQPAEVLALLNDFHSTVVPIVLAYGGTIDKFLGDGFMAYFGAPTPREDHADAAIHCAMTLLDSLDALNLDRGASGQVEFRVGIGLHSGPVVVGDVGPTERREYTAVGATVNIASRIEGLTKELGASLLVSSDTVSRAGDKYEWTAARPAQVKGVSEPVQTFMPARHVVLENKGLAPRQAQSAEPAELPTAAVARTR